MRTRLYFTSESHLHTLLNVLRFSNGNASTNDALSSPDVGSVPVPPPPAAAPVSTAAAAPINTEGISASECGAFECGPSMSPLTPDATPMMLNAATGCSLVSPTGKALLDQISELSYLTQIVFRLFEDVSATDPNLRYKCEISLSPGANGNPWDIKDRGAIDQYITLNTHVPYNVLDSR